MIFLNLSTISFNFHPNYTYHISVSKNLELLNEDIKDYYRIVHIESGTWHILINGSESIFTGPKIICLNQFDIIEILKTDSDNFSIVFFKPTIINNKFDFLTCNSCDLSNKLSTSEFQDLFFLDRFRKDVKNELKFVDIDTITSSSISQNISELNNILTKQETRFWPCKSRALLLQILFCLCVPVESNNDIITVNVPCNFSKLTIEVIYYLQSSYSKKISVSNIAKHFNTNRTTLLNDFKKSTGISITNYLLQLRLKIASALLRDTELNITEICERTGFSDVSYFSKTFKKELKYSPSEYRNKINT